MPSPEDPSLRLQLFLAKAGVASRRQSEALILAGRVQVNGVVVTELGTKVSPQDRVSFDGQDLSLQETKVYIILHKPAGYLSSMSDPEGRKLAYDLIKDKVAERVYNVGRLDLWSTGLLLFTNDGDLARALSHPSCGIEKEYVIRTDEAFPPEFRRKFLQGLEVDGVGYKAVSVTLDSEKEGRIVLVEGKNREIRKVLAYFGLRALSLCRVRLGPLELKGLPVGFSRELTAQEVDALKASIGGNAS